MATKKTGALTTGKRTIKDLINGDEFKEQVAMALPAHCTPERFCRVALTALNRTPKLASCTQQSLFQCLLDLSALGLEPDGRRAHLIPYGDNCTLIIDYKGLVELVLRSGEVSYIHADVVCDGDEFVYDRGELKTHLVDYKGGRGDTYAVYALVRFKDGTEKCEVMTVDEVEKIRKASKAGSRGPWVDHWNEMAKKTVFRRLAKWIPLSAEAKDALDKDDEQFEKPSREFRRAKPVFESKTMLEAAPEEPEETQSEPPPGEFFSDDEIPMEFVKGAGVK